MSSIFHSQFLLRVSLNRVPGCSIVSRKFESDLLQSTVTDRDIWLYPMNIIYSTTANITTLSSSSTLDFNKVLVIGLDSDFKQVIQVINLNGQNKVYLPIPLIRVLNIRNICVNTFLGNVYCYVDCAINAGVPTIAANVRGYVKASDNISLMSHYTIPVGYTGYLVSAYECLTRINKAIVKLVWKSRLFGSVFVCQNKTTLNSDGSSTICLNFDCLEAIPEKTDIVVKCTECSINDVGVGGAFFILLVDNNYIKHIC